MTPDGLTARLSCRQRSSIRLAAGRRQQTGGGRVSEQGPQSRRWIEQRWLIDNIIQANGIDWDQPRSLYLSAPMGPEAAADFAAIRLRVRKFADCSPAFEWAARRREARAETAERAGETVTARDNYFMAAIHWGAAQWPIDRNDERNLWLNARKRECYAAYARLADRRVEEAWIPLGDRKLPAWLHLPPGYAGGRLPAVISIPGMDSFKEGAVALYGDTFLNRGFAVLSLDGPGQYESPVLGIPFTMAGWEQTGRAAYDWLAQRPEIDPDRICISGRSFGSFFATIAAAGEPRLRACAVSQVCHEPGFHTIFQEASPTFKQRFMYMADILDEDAFDRFRQTMTWEGHAQKIAMPYLCLAGEADELSPLVHTERLFRALAGARRLVVYQDARHGIGGVPSAALGPAVAVLMADWLAARCRGEPCDSGRWDVDATGRIHESALP